MKRHLAIFLGALALLSTPAFADTLSTVCDKHDCARVRCNDWGENCGRSGFLEQAHGNFYAPQSHQVCNEFGDCHFAMPTYPPLPQPKPATNPVKPPVITTQ